MVFHSTSTRIMFLGFTAFVAISTYMLVVTHHIKLPTVDLGTGHPHHREKLAVEALHHVLLEDFSKYDVDRDTKLNVHEFAAMLRDAQAKAEAAKQEAHDQNAAQLHSVVEKAATATNTAGDGFVAGSGVIAGDHLMAGGAGGGGSGGRRSDVEERVEVEALDEQEYDDVEAYDFGAVTEGGNQYEADYETEEDIRAGMTAAWVSTNDNGGQKKKQQQAVGAAGTAANGTAGTAANGTEGTAQQPATTTAAATNTTGTATAVVATTAATSTAAADGAAAVAAVQSPGCPELSREHVAQFARENTIMLTVADWRIFGSMGINWMKHLAKWGVDYYLVGATCVKTAQFLGHTGKHQCFKFYEDGSHSGSDQYKYGDSHYNAATWRKVVVVSRMVHWGFNVIHSDVDVVWFRDPLPYFLGPHVAQCDMAVSSDLISTQNPKGDDGLEIGMHQHTNFNTGVYFVRATPGGKSLMAGWAAMRSTNYHDNDQFGIYKFIRGRSSHMDGRVLVMGLREGEAEAAKVYAANPEGFDRKRSEDPLPVSTEMRLGGLPVHMMLNGYSYFIPKLHTNMNITPLAIHMTWVPLSKEGKFHRFRDGMLYDDPPDYYDAPGLRFLTADIDAPDAPEGFNSWRETEDMIQVHLKNIPPQMKQMYRAIAASVVLNRTLIFPRLKCYCFKNWFMSEQCRIPGDKVTQFPLDCALDQVFRPKVLYNYPPLNTANGPHNFTFREYSMLDNPRTPDTVKQGQVLVVPEGADAGNTTGFLRVVTIKPNLKQDELVKALDEIKDAKVIRLRHPLLLFGGFNDQVLQASFETFATNITANWCCRDEPFIKKGLPKKVKMAMEW